MKEIIAPNRAVRMKMLSIVLSVSRPMEKEKIRAQTDPNPAISEGVAIPV